MIKIKVLLTVAALSAGVLSGCAQEKSKRQYLLPDGKIIGEDKLDSLKTAWGEDRMVKDLNYQDANNPNIQKLNYLSDEELAMLKGQIPDKPDDSYVGKPAVDFNLTDMDGKKVSLSELKGKVVVLNFWFTLCKPCVKEMPELNELTEKYKNDKDVVFLGITFNNTEDVKKFMADHEFNYRIIPNAAELVREYNMSIFPHNAIIDKNGIIKYFTGGYKENLGMVLSTFIDMLK